MRGLLLVSLSSIQTGGVLFWKVLAHMLRCGCLHHHKEFSGCSPDPDPGGGFVVHKPTAYEPTKDFLVGC